MTRRRSTPPPDLGHTPTADLGPRRQLDAGDEATILLPGRSTKLRCRFVRQERDGSLTFVHPHNGGLRTVSPDAVDTIHRKLRLR